MTKRPIVAFLYDFDKTLCTTDMEDYTFIPSLGYPPSEFWAKANGFGYENKMDGLLAYMYTMIRECAAQGIRLDRDYLVRSGEAIELFPGVREWFARITAYGADLGVDVEHYVISSGHRGQRHRPRVQADLRLRVLLRRKRPRRLAEAGRQLHEQDAVRLPHQQGHS